MGRETGTSGRKATADPAATPTPTEAWRETGTYVRKAATDPAVAPTPAEAWRETGTSGRKATALALAALADRQHAVFSLAQLVALGLSESVVHKRTSFIRLYRIHRGVYSLVPATLLSRHGHYMAAVLAAGPGAVLSHRSAAELHGLLPNSRTRIEVLVAGTTHRKRPGLQIHRSRTLTHADTTTVAGIPCTTVARTLLDLAAVVPTRRVERAFDQAEVLGCLDAGAIEDQLKRNPTGRGAKRLRAVLTQHRAGTTVTESELEEQMLTVCREAGLPKPAANAWIVLDDEEPALRVDFLWRDEKLIVETDGHRFHGTHRAFEVDRDRDQRLTVARWTVIRVTWRQLRERPDTVTDRIRRLLARLSVRTTA